MGFNSLTAGKRERAIQLRFEGLSYGQIMNKLDISSKGTLSTWFKHLHLPPTVIKKLEKNTRLATERGLLEFNKRRTMRIAIENKSIRASGSKEIEVLNKHHLRLIGAALYWAEGTKFPKNGRYPALDFANSDPLMVRLFLRFVREILCVQEEKIRAGIHIYPGMDEVLVREFWSEVTGLPKDRFHIGRWVSSASKGKRSIRRLPYGTANIRVNSRQIFFRVMGMIEGIGRITKTV